MATGADTEAGHSPTPSTGATRGGVPGWLVRLGGRFMGDSLLWRLLRESVPGQKQRYIVAVLAMLVVAATAAGAAWSMGAIVDSMTDPDNRGRVLMVAAAVVGIFMLKGAASYVQVVSMTRAGNRIVAEKQELLYQRLLGQGVSFFNLTESSDTLMRMTQSAQMARRVIDTIVTGFVRDLFTLIGLLGVMFYQQPMLSMICLILGPVVLWGLRRLLSRVREIMSQEMAGLAEIIKVVQETSTGVRVVKAFALEDRMAARMGVAVRQVEQRANKIAKLEAATAPLLDTLTGLAIGAIVVLSAVNLFGAQAGTPGQLMSFVTALLMAYEPAKRLSRMRVSIEAGMVGVRMMYELLDRPLTLLERPGAVALRDGPGEVRMERVRFGYAPEAPVIDGMDLTFEAGRTTALVGPSGGGKSTILNLVMRMYDPFEGRILIDGQDIADTTFASLRSRIAFVGQDTFLFSTSVMENLRFGRPDASDEEVIEAARIAHADEFIRALPKGYDTPVGENGAFLSGGQRQRIAIARAVLRRAPILLLDEATSALDSHSEALVRDALDRITRGVTTIVIAHRLSTVMGADTVCYIEGGRVVEQGPMDTLLTNSGKFRALFDEQFGHAARRRPE
ncbi:MAG: ABC transporter ATP-binding protein [Alkalilacustris sp.]